MRFRFVRHVALFLFGMFVISACVQMLRGEDIWRPGGAAAAFVAAALVMLPIGLVADIIAHRKRRGTGSAAR